MLTQRDIDDFLVGRRVVLLGVSVTSTDYSRLLLRGLVARGHDVIPVRPGGVGELEGRRVYANLWEVPGEIDTALILTPPHTAERATFECIERGVLRIWIDPGSQRGANEDAVELAEEHGCYVLVGGNPLAQGLFRRLRRDTGRRASSAA